MAPETLSRLTPPELRDQSFGRRVIAALAFFLIMVCAAGMLLTAGSGCGAGAKGCAVVDATKVVVDRASEACVVLRYLDEGGAVREEHVSVEDLRDLGARAAAKRLSAASAGSAQLPPH